MANRVFLDTNILLDELFNDRNCSTYTKKIIDEYIYTNSKFVINDLSLNTLYYIGSKLDRDKTLNFMKDISFNNPMFEIHYMQERDLKEIYNYIDVVKNADFEDLQQYISAKNSNCDVIITNDKNFPKLDIPLIRTNPNLENYTPENKSETNETKEKKGFIDKLIDFARKNR